MDYQTEWEQNFTDRAKNIQIEFDAFFKNKPLDDYYVLREESGGKLSLHFTDNHGLPDEIVKALTAAFIQSNPANE